MRHLVHPSPRPRCIGCEKTVIRQTPRVRPPPVQACCGDDTRRHVGAGLGRRPSISCRIAANSRRGIATSASWNVMDRPCRATLAPILISFSRSVVSDQCATSLGSANVAFCAGFSDARHDAGSWARGCRRPRSAKARNRGGLPGLWGFDRDGDDGGARVARLW